MDLGLFSTEIQADQKVSSRERWSLMQVAQSSLREHRSGLGYLTALLETAKSEIASDGYISENIRNKIFFAFCLWDCLFALTCLNAGPSATKAENSPSSDVGDKEADNRRAFVVAFIDRRLGLISTLKEYATERDELTLDAEARSLKLAARGCNGQTAPLRAHLDRQLYRVMDQLERLQRQRRGEAVPPPLNIWEEGDKFCQTKPRSTLFSMAAIRKAVQLWRML